MAEETEVLDNFKFNLQLFAEDTEVIEQEATSDETVEDTESQESTQEAVETEQTEYEFEVGGEKIKLDRDKFNEVLTATRNAEKWDKKYHEKGRKLNQFSQELQTKEKELANDKQLLDEWKAVKQKLDAHPESRKVIADALNTAKPSIDPVIQAVQKENADLRKDMERDKAEARMAKEFEDFDNDELAQFQGDFNLDNMFDAMKFTYLAKKGASIDDAVQKARVDVVKGMRNKKGSPPTGKKASPPPPKDKTWNEMVESAYARVDNEGTIINRRR